MSINMSDRSLLTKQEVETNKKALLWVLRNLSIEDKNALIEIGRSVLQFTEEQSIAFMDLLPEEEDRLAAIIKMAVQTRDEHEQQMKDDLIAWSQNLVYAKRGQTKATAEDTNSIAADLSLIDLQRCLAFDTTDPQDIDHAGAYILPAVDLRSVTSSLTQTLAQALTSIQQNRIGDAVVLSIPVISKNNQFRLAEIDIKNGAIAAVNLREYQEKLPAFTQQIYRILSEAISAVTNIEPKVFSTTEYVPNQSMDYCIKRAYERTGIINPITSAKDPGTLRVAVVKQMTVNHASMSSDDAAVKANSLLEAMTDKQNKNEHSISEKAWQVSFDSVFAKHLQKLYSKNENTGFGQEQNYIKKARDSALLEMGFFAPGKNNHPMDLEPKQVPQIEGKLQIKR